MAISRSTTPSQVKVLQRQIAELQTQLGGSSTGQVRTLTMTKGESAELVLKAWKRANPGEQLETAILWTVVGQVPRDEFATADSIAEALPLVRPFLAQIEDERTADAWRRLARMAGVDYETGEPLPAEALN